MSYKILSKSGEEMNYEVLETSFVQKNLLEEGFLVKIDNNKIRVDSRIDMSGYVVWDASVYRGDMYLMSIGDNEGGDISVDEIAMLIEEAYNNPHEFARCHVNFIDEAGDVFTEEKRIEIQER